MANLSSKMRRYQVTDVSTLEEFFTKYTKAERYAQRGAEHIKAVIASAQEDLKKYGFVIISTWNSNTGEIVAFFE